LDYGNYHYEPRSYAGLHWKQRAYETLSGSDRYDNDGRQVFRPYVPSRERSQSAGRADPQRLHAQEDQEQASVDSKNLKNRKRSGAQSASKEGRSAPKLKIFIQNQTLQYVSLAPKRDDEKLAEEREATNTHLLNGAIECGGDEVEELGQEDSEEAQCNL